MTASRRLAAILAAGAIPAWTYAFVFARSTSVQVPALTLVMIAPPLNTSAYPVIILDEHQDANPPKPASCLHRPSP